MKCTDRYNMKNPLLVLILLLKSFLIFGHTNEKCCNQSQSIILKNSAFVCEINTNKRIVSNFENTDFFNKKMSGSCIDLYSQNKTAVFSVDVTTKMVSMEKNLNVKYFHKCCPLGQKYNKTIHSCASVDDRNDREKILIHDSLIKIGLPQCKIISDDFFASYQDLLRHYDAIILDTVEVIVKENFCVDSTVQGDFVMRKCEKNDRICEKIRCIHKCCPDGQSYVNGSKCIDTFKYGVDLHSTDKIHEPHAPFVVIHGIQKPIFALIGDQYNFSVDKNGVFSVHREDVHLHFAVSHNKYCMEHAKARSFNGYYMFSTASKPEMAIKFTVTRWAKLLSCICLLLTVLVYVLVPKMRNLFGNILLCYSVATFLMFFSLAFTQFFHEILNDVECQVIGYVSVLVIIWSFTWLHVMCIDIWISFRTPRSTVGPLQKGEIKTLVKYSLCGWGIPILWILVIALLGYIEGVPHEIRPYVGEMKCFLEGTDTRSGNYAFILFLVVPLSIQQIINTVLFVSTIMHYLQTERKRDGRPRKNLRVRRERLILIVKLTVIMGVSFLFETVSSIFDFSSTTITEYIEVVWDTINCLQGVFIFIVFICKKKVYNYIYEELPFLKTRKITSVPSSATQHISLQPLEKN